MTGSERDAKRTRQTPEIYRFLFIMSAPITASSHTHVGTPPPEYHEEEWVTHTVHFHGFGSLSAERGARVYSPEFMLLGNQWRLKMYPSGRRDADEGMAFLGLNNMSDKAIDIDYGFSVNDGNGKQVAYQQTDYPRNFGPVGTTNSGRGFDFVKRSKLMQSLVKGTLIIEVRMRLAKPTTSVSPPFIPENPLTKMIQEEFLEEKYSDIVFEVGGDQRKDNAKKVAKIAPVTFPAHRIIVAKISNTLAELCASGAGDYGTTRIPIEIDNVSPDIFRLLLSYMYGMTISNDNMKSHAKEIIDVADRFGVTSLKLEAEAYFVKTTTFTMENVMELLLYAESKNYALLKEAAMDYIVENKADIIKKLSFTDAPGSFLNDVLVACVMSENEDGTVGDIESQLASMRVSQLRKKAHEMGLGVDGSRGMLIAAIKENLEKVHGY